MSAIALTTKILVRFFYPVIMYGGFAFAFFLLIGLIENTEENQGALLYWLGFMLGDATRQAQYDHARKGEEEKP